MKCFGVVSYPPREEWDRVVVGQLTATRDWIVVSKRSRRIVLTGQRRLSASVAIGAVFNATSGFVKNRAAALAEWRELAA